MSDGTMTVLVIAILFGFMAFQDWLDYKRNKK